MESQREQHGRMPAAAKRYVSGVIAAGCIVFTASVWHWTFPEPWRYLVYLVLALLASLLKLRLPGIEGTYSLNFLFVLIGIAYFGLPGTLVAGCAAVLVQCVCNARRRPTLVQILFNMANLAVSIGICFLTVHGLRSAGLQASQAAALALIACVYFFTNTMLVSGVLSLLEGKPLQEVCQHWYLWAFPYYLVGAAVVGLLPLAGRSRAPESWLILLPLLYLVHFYYGLAHESSPARNTGNAEERAPSLPIGASVYIATTVVAGLIVLVAGALYWQSASPLRFLCYLAVALLASTCKVRLPRMTSTISLNFVVLLLAVAQLSFSEAITISSVAAIVQSLWKPKERPRPVQVLFNSASLVLSTALAYAVSRFVLAGPALALLVQATVLLYGCNSMMVAAVLRLTEDKPMNRLWWRCYFWSFPYYVVGAAAAYVVVVTSGVAGWQPPLLAFSLMVLVFVSYRLHVNGAGQEPQPVVERTSS